MGALTNSSELIAEASPGLAAEIFAAQCTYLMKKKILISAMSHPRGAGADLSSLLRREILDSGTV